MRRRSTTLVHAVALCVALSGALNPAFASGLIPTEQAASPGQQQSHHGLASAQRARLHATLIEGGVESGHAAQRLAALTDAEIAELTLKIDAGPAGGLWFMPFLVVAAVIGVLISTRDAAPSGPSKTDLFGRPRLAVAP